MINVCLLGATGSIGTQTIEVLAKLEGFQIVSMSCNENVEKLKELLTPSVKDVAIASSKNVVIPGVNVHFGQEGIIELIEKDDVDIVVNALSGVAGLPATISSIINKKKLLLANKESLVLAGDIVKELVHEYNGIVLPIDSEHSAIWQLLSERNDLPEKVIITASGGALREIDRAKLKNISIDDVLNHPTWKMGGKITVDSSSMVNKAFEVIEAHYLFNLPYDKIDTLINKESYIHAIVKWQDDERMILSHPDMHMPIEYAFTQMPIVPSLKFCSENIQGLTLTNMDHERFPLFDLGVNCAKMGGIMKAVFCIANDVAVKKFLDGKIKYLEIEDIIFKEVEYYKDKNIFEYTINDIYHLIEEINNKHK